MIRDVNSQVEKAIEERCRDRRANVISAVRLLQEALFFCVYDEPSVDLCLHKDLHLANVHHRAAK